MMLEVAAKGVAVAKMEAAAAKRALREGAAADVLAVACEAAVGEAALWVKAAEVVEMVGGEAERQGLVEEGMHGRQLKAVALPAPQNAVQEAVEQAVATMMVIQESVVVVTPVVPAAEGCIAKGAQADVSAVVAEAALWVEASEVVEKVGREGERQSLVEEGISLVASEVVLGDRMAVVQ